VRDEGLIILREVESAQRAYEQLQQRINQTSLESQTTQSNVNFLTQAEPPLEPSSPRIVLNTLLSIFLGTLLAIGTALLLELRDRRVRNVDDVLASLDLPVIGVMPKPGDKGMMGRKRVSMLQQRLMAPLPPATATKGA
jgi:capsular polysaccharide biosynthesis protein